MIRNILLITLLLFTTTSSLYAKNELFVSDMTIKELWKNIEKLKEEEKKLNEKSSELSKDYKELVWFIKDDLNFIEIDEISIKIDEYIEKRDELELWLKTKVDKLEETKDIKNQILIEKANFYRYIAKYVDINKRDAFIEHIKTNIQATKERKDLIEEILKNQNLVDKKVTYLKDKIETHKEELATKIETSVKSKINERIDTIDKNEKYKDLDAWVKNKIYWDFINQLKQKLEEIEKSNLSTSYKERMSLIYKSMIKNIEEKMKK